MDLGLSGRACIVSGASRGIGLEVARRLHAEGAGVLILGRGEPTLRAAAQAASGGRAEPGVDWRVLDVTAPDAGERAVEACVERFGRLDVLVNNAGGNDVRTLEQLTDADWQQHFDRNVMAPMRLMRAAVPVMVAAQWGRVVNVNSSSAKRAGKANAAYSVTKTAQLSLSRAFADIYARQGVLINSVTPGPVSNDLWLEPGGLVDQSIEAGGGTREEFLRGLAAAVPSGRLAESDEIAAVIVFLCSELSSNVVGAAWSVDGGTVPVII